MKFYRPPSPIYVSQLPSDMKGKRLKNGMQQRNNSFVFIYYGILHIIFLHVKELESEFVRARIVFMYLNFDMLHELCG